MSPLIAEIEPLLASALRGAGSTEFREVLLERAQQHAIEYGKQKLRDMLLPDDEQSGG